MQAAGGVERLRMPWGNAAEIFRLMPRDQPVSLLGCLSFERRCTVLPHLLSSSGQRIRTMHLITIQPPLGGYPDYSNSVAERVAQNRDTLLREKVAFYERPCGLLDVEDQLMSLLNDLISESSNATIILDCTSFPKRFFCFFIRQLLVLPIANNLIVTYTDAGSAGYGRRLSHDPMRPDYLPGFPFSSMAEGETLVISVGYEPLGMRSIIETYAEQGRPKFLLSFSNDPSATRRQWNTLRYMRPHRAIVDVRENAEVVAAWDAERVYQVLRYWCQNSNGLMLAPFGPKPHTIGMATFAAEYGSCMIYTQPRSYDPSYTRGHGTSWAYVLKWGGTPCYQRDDQVI